MGRSVQRIEVIHEPPKSPPANSVAINCQPEVNLTYAFCLVGDRVQFVEYNMCGERHLCDLDRKEFLQLVVGLNELRTSR